MSSKYIAIAGNIGSGKSCLTSFLCKHFGIRPFYEPNDINPYLEDFYKDMKKWAYHSQIHFLTHKFRLHQELEKCPETVVQDRTIYEDAEIFAKHLHKSGYIPKREYNTYATLYKCILESLRPPDIMIYLDCSMRSLKRRIRERGRKMEQAVSTDYLRKLGLLYKKWIADYKMSPLITISTEKYDYMDDFITRNDVLEQIGRYL